jgi:hypothetical protein
MDKVRLLDDEGTYMKKVTLFHERFKDTPPQGLGGMPLWIMLGLLREPESREEKVCIHQTCNRRT